jgi:DNA-directed RNA polymerase subunit K
MIQKEEFTKYEVARILGARALQISMNAPLLMDMDKEKLEQINYDSIKIAEIEFNSGVLPITVKRPLPKKKEDKVKIIKEEIKRGGDVEEEKKEEEEIVKEGHEIMELSTPEDEIYEEEEEEEDFGE